MEKEAIKLIEKAQKGESQAFGEFYKIYLQRIYRFIFYMVNVKEVAEDLTQNTFLKAWRNITLYLPARGSPSTFLFAIAKNLVVDYQRKPKSVKIEQIEELGTEEDLVENYSKIEAKNEVDKLLASLDKGEKQLIVLRYFEEMSFREIGQIYLMKETAVRVRIHRILQKIKNQKSKIKSQNE